MPQIDKIMTTKTDKKCIFCGNFLDYYMFRNVCNLHPMGFQPNFYYKKYTRSFVEIIRYFPEINSNIYCVNIIVGRKIKKKEYLWDIIISIRDKLGYSKNIYSSKDHQIIKPEAILDKLKTILVFS